MSKTRLKKQRRRMQIYSLPERPASERNYLQNPSMTSATQQANSSRSTAAPFRTIGASREGNKGKIELAEGGTLFLDEMGDMPLDMQVKFLRVLQEKQYFKLGGNKEKSADFRLVSATNRKIADLLASEDFRSDLLYR